jgi:hypothetical protein
MKSYSVILLTISICCMLAVIGGALLKIEGNSWGNTILNIGLGLQVLLLAILIGKSIKQDTRKKVGA